MAVNDDDDDDLIVWHSLIGAVHHWSYLRMPVTLSTTLAVTGGGWEDIHALAYHFLLLYLIQPSLA